MTSSAAVSLAIVTAGAMAAALIAHAVVLRLLRRIGRRLPNVEVLIERSRRSGRVVLASVALASAWSGAAPTATGSGIVSHGLAVVLILAFSWLVVDLLLAAEEISFRRYDTSVADNLRARKVRTQILVLRRVTVVIVAVIAAAAALLTFQGVRTVGTSLLASAGIAGLVAGTAARPVLGNLISGIQLAFTEPIRLDDVLVIGADYGWVEEITLTYVVLWLWDRRRLVLPVSYFTSTPFENWTRNSADLLGVVYLYLDYCAPVDALRKELERIVTTTPLWDGGTVGLQVTDATERTVQVRALVSAADSSSAFDLRCLVREQLVAWVQHHHPEALPRDRFVEGPQPAALAGA